MDGDSYLSNDMHIIALAQISSARLLLITCQL